MQGRIRKAMLRWLQADEKYLGNSFQKDEQGRDIFYPWGHSGEGYYVSESQKKNIKTFCLFSYFISVALLLYWALIAGEPVGGSFFALASFLVMIPWSFLVMVFSHYYVRKMSPRLRTDSTYSKVRARSKLEGILLYTVILICVALTIFLDSSSFSSWVCTISIVVFYPVYFLFVQLRLAEK